MTFNDFLPLIHSGVQSAFYLVNDKEGYCVVCKSRYDLIRKLKENGFLSDLSYNIVGIQPHGVNSIIIEFEKR